MSISIGQATIFEDTGVVLMSRLVFDDGNPVQQADLSTISYGVWDADSGTVVIASGTSLTISSVIFDTLQTDARWESTDSTGYNFRVTLPSTAFPSGGKSYRVEFLFTPESGQPFFDVWEVSTVEVLTS